MPTLSATGPGNFQRISNGGVGSPDAAIAIAVTNAYGWHPELASDVIAISGKADAASLAAEPNLLKTAVSAVKTEQPDKFLPDFTARRLDRVTDDNRRFKMAVRETAQFRDRWQKTQRRVDSAMERQAQRHAPVPTTGWKARRLGR